MLSDARLLARYLRVVAIHKWAIVAAGLDVRRKLRGSGLGVSIGRLVRHDLSKLSRAELLPYARHFGGAGSDGFAAAWRHHYEANDHHPEFHRGARMPDEAVVEMVVDWLAASRAYEGAWPCCGGHWRWLEDHWDDLEMHLESKALAARILETLGYGVSVRAAR